MLNKIRLVIKDNELCKFHYIYTEITELLLGNELKLIKSEFTKPQYLLESIDIFTGLKDSNRSDIYSGDILKFSNGKLRTVIEIPGGFGVEHLDKDFSKIIKVIFYSSYDSLTSKVYYDKIKDGCIVVGSKYEGVVNGC